MKTAYELAMERLNKTGPTVKLTGKQKKALSELDSKYAAKIAAREIHLKERMELAKNEGDLGAVQALEQQLAAERSDLNRELEEKKEAVRGGGSR